MRIGIDIGGSHIAVGLVENGRIITKREKDFCEEDKQNIEKRMEDSLIECIEEIINIEQINIEEIEKIRNWSSRRY